VNTVIQTKARFNLMSRREKVRRLAEREAEKEKRGRLQSVLVQKLAQRQGLGARSKSSNLVPKKVLVDAVKAYLEEKPFLVETTDIRLCNHIVEQIWAEVPKVAAKLEAVRIQAVESRRKNKEENRAESSIATLSETTSNSENTVAVDGWNKVNPWHAIETFQTLKAERTTSTNKENAVRRRKEMATNLHEQIRLKENEGKDVQKEENKFVAFQTQQQIKWKEETDVFARKEREKSIELRRVREEQIKEQKMKRKEEMEKARAMELEEISEVKRKLAEEEEKKRQTKVQERENWERIKVETQAEMEKKQLQREREAALDAKLMSEMKAKLDREEAVKAKALAERMARSEMMCKQMTKAGAFNLREERKKLDRKILKEAKAKEMREVELDRRKREMTQMKKKNIMETNKKMTEEKKRREREEEEAEAKEFASQCRREKEALLAEEEAQRLKKAETQKECSNVLKKQIEELKRQQAMYDMTSVERSINKDLMSKLESDVSLQKQIVDKLFSSGQSEPTLVEQEV